MPKENFTWGKPIEPPKAKSWKPRKGETRVFKLLRQAQGKFGMSYVVTDVGSNEEMFLPHHVMLGRRLDAAGLHAGNVFQVKCTQEGSENPGDNYDYEVRVAKGNTPF